MLARLAMSFAYCALILRLRRKKRSARPRTCAFAPRQVSCAAPRVADEPARRRRRARTHAQIGAKSAHRAASQKEKKETNRDRLMSLYASLARSRKESVGGPHVTCSSACAPARGCA
jgi:hypothetical protein